MGPDRTILRLSTLNDLSAVGLSIGMINKTHKIVSVEG
jgi:hypothetical protein